MRTSSRLSQTLDLFGRIGDKMKLPDDDNAAVTEVLTDYYRAFRTLDAQAVFPYFHEPSQLIKPSGCRADADSRRRGAAFQPVMDALRSRGFIKSELVDLHLKRLSATTVIAGGVAVRRKTDRQELDRAGVVYLLQRTSAGWQFATVAIHDAEDALRPE
jgi:ketosteroid isomerase-like protein